MRFPLARTLVPPHASAYGLEAGKSTWSARSGWPSLEPLSPEATHTVTPIVAASQRANELNAAHLIPPGFDAWFASVVVRDPSHRYQDASQAFGALASVLQTYNTTQGGYVHPPSYTPAGTVVIRR